MERTLVCIFVLWLVISTRAHYTINVLEGDLAEFHFQYPCGSTEVTLQRGNETLFYYRTRNPEIALPDLYPVDRFAVEDTTGGDNCSLHLTINPVERSDGGTYYCKPYKNASVFSECLSIELNVEFCPGKALCEWIEERTFETNGWTTLSCTASAGSLLGHIECYQNGETVPPKTRPLEANGTLHQSIWVRSNSDNVFCCSTTSEHPRDRCQCKDYLWNPSTDTNSSITVAPGPVATPGQRNPSARHTPPPTQLVTLENSSIEYHGTYWLVIGLVIVILILFVRLMFYYRAFHNQDRLKNKPVDPSMLSIGSLFYLGSSIMLYYSISIVVIGS